MRWAAEHLGFTHHVFFFFSFLLLLFLRGGGGVSTEVEISSTTHERLNLIITKAKLRLDRNVKKKRFGIESLHYHDPVHYRVLITLILQI